MLTYLSAWLSNFAAMLEQEEGQGMAEYGLLLALIAVVVIAVLVLLGPAIASQFSTVASGVS